MGVSRSNYRGMTPHMIGKVDRVGRFIPEEIKYANWPNHPFWVARRDTLQYKLVTLMGADAYNDWVDSPEVPDRATYKRHCEIWAAKLAQVRSCKHEWAIEQMGGIQLSAGEVDDDIETRVICRICGAEKPAEVVEEIDDDELPF